MAVSDDGPFPAREKEGGQVVCVGLLINRIADVDFLGDVKPRNMT
jgi:hypothetical protein